MIEIDLSFITSFFADIYAFLSSGIYHFATQTMAQLVIWSTIGLIQFKIYSLTFAAGVAREILLQLNFSSFIQSAFDSLDSNVSQIIGYLKVPEAINIISSAAVTKYVLRFLGL